MHDLVSCETGLPPNTKVKIELDKNDDAFVLMTKEEDNEKYRVKILNISLFVPVAQLSSQVFQETANFWRKK